MIVYHGSIQIVNFPDIMHSYRYLDFGPGFYVTTVQNQAEHWAIRKSWMNKKKTPLVNRYELSSNYSGLKMIDFTNNLYDWLDFVCNCRSGNPIYKDYDIILGKVADDKVFRVVNMYMRNSWDRERALEEMKIYELYDQICFVSQRAIDQTLSFVDTYEVSP